MPLNILSEEYELCLICTFVLSTNPVVNDMIIGNMGIEEMQKEAGKDIDLLYTKMHYLLEENRRFFIKSTKFPASKIFRWKSRITKNEWNIILLARNKKEQICPSVVPYVKYQSYGTGIVYIRRLNDKIFTIVYTPHFLKRYRERCLGDDGQLLSTDEIVYHLYTNTLLPTYYFPPDGNKFILYISQGIVLGDYTIDKSILQAKTFVSRDMLFSKQMEKDEFAIEIRSIVTKSEEYHKDNRHPFGVNKYTGEVEKIDYF